MGGQTHARRDCASGYSYVNDVVLAILTLLRAPSGALEDSSNTGGERRVLYVNLDGYHSSGVEEAFYTTDRVLCLSLHRHAEGVFPGSGWSTDVGMDAGKHHNINLPVSAGLDDEGVAALLLPVLAAAAAKFCPHCVVCSAGAGVMAGDRTGCLNISLDGYVRMMTALKELNLPLLVLGGCAFTQLTAAKAWTAATAALCGVPTPTELADGTTSSAALDSYPPSELELSVPKAVMDDMNTPAALEATKEAALKTVASMSQRSAPGVRTKRALPPPDAATSEVKSEGGAGGAEGAPASGAEADAIPTAIPTGDSAVGSAAATGRGAPTEPPAGAAADKEDAEMGEAAEGGGEGDAAMEAPPADGPAPVATAAEEAKAMEDRMVAEEPGLGDDD